MNYIKYDVYQVSVDYRYNSGFENGRRDVLMRLLKTTLGDKLLEFEIPLTVSCQETTREAVNEYVVTAHFTTEQRETYEKWEMVQKLAGIVIT